MGINIEIGADGNISNYTEVMTGLFNELDAAEKAAGEEANEEEQKVIDAISEKIDDLKSVIGQYDETRKLLQDLDNQI
jgi:hypothetical protein